MSHFLSRHHHGASMRLKAPRAAVRVELQRRNRLCIMQDIAIVKPGSVFAPLPEGVEIVTPDGESVPATGTFYVSVETLDPFHIVIDLFPVTEGGEDAV